MTDQCKFCTVRGDIEKCLSTECTHHENWIASQHRSRYEALLAQVEELRNAYEQRLITMTNEDVDAAFSKSAQQSIDSLKARIEEETIARCAATVVNRMGNDWRQNVVKAVETMPRKYRPSTKADKGEME